MKSESFVIIALIVAICIVLNAIVALIITIIKHYWAKYQHYKMIQARHDRFYSELRMFMKSA
jgi:hypothetical protein